MVVRNNIFLILGLLLLNSLKGHGDSSDKKGKTDFVLCRFCGYNIAPATSLVNIRSPAAEERFNSTFFDLDILEIQKVKNPLGIHFNIVTSTGATCIATPKRWHAEHSWFPGYLWKPCYCSHCSKLIGWVFEPIASAHDDRIYASLKGFYTFILDSIISEKYSDSLLARPKISRYEL